MMLKKICFASFLFVSVAQARGIQPPPYSDMQGKRLSDLECATVNLYHESRGESDIANQMIIAIVLNRVDDKRFPDTICEVVFQRKQFSWLHDGKSDKITDIYQYKRLYRIVEQTLVNRKFVQNFSEGVTHYHTKSIKPYWSYDNNMEMKFSVDNHLFYRWR